MNAALAQQIIGLTLISALRSPLHLASHIQFLLILPFFTLPALTDLHDFAEDVLLLQEVAGGTVPAAVFELVLALVDRQFEAACHSSQDTRIVSD